MDAFSLRFHAPGDRPFIRQMLETAALTTYHELESLGRVTRRERLDAIFDFYYGVEQKRIWILASPAGAPVGMLWMQPSMHPVTELSDFMVLNVAVLPDYRGQGLGRRLMEKAREDARSLGVNRLRLFVGARNEAAYGLYKALGYEEQTREMLLKL